MRLILILLVFWPLHTSIKNIDALSFAQNGKEGFYNVDLVDEPPFEANVDRRPSAELKKCPSKQAHDLCLKN